MGAAAESVARLGDALAPWQDRAARDLAARLVDAQRQALAAVAPSGRLRGFGPRGSNPRPGSPLGVESDPAPAHTPGGTAYRIGATGPWWAVEYRRRGGYVIPGDARTNPRRRILHFGGRWAAYSHGGAVLAPRQPWARGIAQGRQPAVVAVRESFDQLVASGGGS